MSLYRQYRPQNFSDLVGQIDLAQTLKTQLSAGKFSHAYLFVGPRGTGKTTTARIVAKVLNCASPKDGEPCNKCVSCFGVNTGSNLDVIEIDAASNRGIEEIRDLREKIRLAPTQGAYKTYIIDEVHMLTTEAFNALLKTLEEPPKHVVFILCTTDVHKIPATIISRCQKFEFAPASIQNISLVVKKIAKKENFEIDAEALAAIAASGDGSYRDALTVLEQASSGGKVSAEKINRMVRRGGNTDKLLQLIDSENAVGSLELVFSWQESGINLSFATAELVHKLRVQLLQAVRDSNDVRQLKTVRLIRLFSRAHAELKAAVLPTLPLELAIIESVGTKERIVAEVVHEVVQEAVREEVRDEDPGTVVGSIESDDLSKLKASWDKLLRAIKPFNHSLEAFLRGCEPYEISGKVVTLKFFYKFHKDMVDQAKNKSLVEREIGNIMGKEVRIKTVLGEKREAKRISVDEVKNVEEVASDDLVQKAVDIFNSNIN